MLKIFVMIRYKSNNSSCAMHLKRGKIRPGQLSVLAEAGRATVVLSALQNWLKDVQFPVTPVDLYFSTVSQRGRRGGQGAGLPYKKGRGVLILPCRG